MVVHFWADRRLDPPAFFLGSTAGSSQRSSFTRATRTRRSTPRDRCQDRRSRLGTNGPHLPPPRRHLLLYESRRRIGRPPVVTGLSSGSSGHQVQTLKYDRSTGAVVWGPVAFDPANTFVTPSQVAVDANNDAFLLGYQQSLIDTSQYGTFLIKYSGSTGGVLWGPTVLANLAPQAIALDAAGDAVVLNWSQDPGTFATHAATAKVSGTNGSNSLGARFRFVGAPRATTTQTSCPSMPPVTPSSSAKRPPEARVGSSSSTRPRTAPSCCAPSSHRPVSRRRPAVDAVGDLAVSGNDDLFTMTTFKLSGSTGAALWGTFTLATASAATVAVATNGDVVASGVTILSGSNLDFVTIRYKSSDGSVLWGPVTTDSAAHGLDEPFGLAFDASGNVVLGGSSQALNLNLDISLVKYDAATGATLWGPVYVGRPRRRAPRRSERAGTPSWSAPRARPAC